ncbi:unnamed protein product [Haemonchus placei]|uniref:FLYWCH-type domain-containing protein n=1 Tax=Haemonchus placei TaxID=6290 RepID=A0A0N4XB99_HAEPC|nr:unnamed protein product [Haemonchus placei]
MVKLSGERFPAILESSKYGKHPTLRFPIPGQPMRYTFEYMRTATQGEVVYRCRGCRKNWKTTSVAVVSEHYLVGNPVLLPQVCIRRGWYIRHSRIFPRMRVMRYAHMRAKQVYQNIAQQADHSEVAGRLPL